MKNFLHFIAVLTIVLVVTSSGIIPNDSLNYGLTFNSYNVTQDERTSMYLNSNKAINGKKGFSIEFDYRIVPISAFGYVFRFIDDRQNHIDFVSYHDASHVNVIFGDANNVISNAEIPTKKDGRWNHFYLSLNPHDSTIKFSHNGEKEYEFYTGKVKFGKFRLYFGRIDDKRYFTSDIPNFTIKNINVYNEHRGLIGSWPLTEHTPNAAFDTCHNYRALVRNGKWEIDSHVKWKFHGTFYVASNFPQISVSKNCDKLFVAWDDSIMNYNFGNGEHSVSIVKSGSVDIGNGCHMICRGDDNALVSYDLVGISKLNFYDSQKGIWTRDGSRDMILNQPGVFYDFTTDEILVFGGYGMHHYSDTLFKVDLKDSSITKYPLPIAPRYLCSVGEYNNELIIIGGYGSKSGKQEEDPRIFNDVFSVNPTTLEVKKLGNIKKTTNSSLVFNRSFISDVENGRIFALAFNNELFNSSINLVALDMNTLEMELYSNPIPFKFLDIRSSNDLFYNHVQNKLYAIVSQPKGELGSEISIYSISFPPLHNSSVIIMEDSNMRGLIIIGVSFLLLVMLGFLGFSKKRNSKEIDISQTQIITETPAGFDKSCVRLLGEFRVYDHKGLEITKEFSPTVRNIFSFLILETVKGTSEINIQQFDSLFWPDMERNKVLNNRRVNLSKLRALLIPVGDIRIITYENSLKFVWDTNVLCDYWKLMNLLQGNNSDRSTLYEVISLGSLGSLLPEVDLDWMDSYKSDLTWHLSSLLVNSKLGDSKEDLSLRLQLANIVLMNDPIDEEAISAKCATLFKLGQKSMAKKTFESFVSRYEKILNVSPNISFEDTIKWLT